VAHPTKPMHGVSKVPGLYDISGSANWANKPDYGLTYHRPDPTQNRAVIRVHKVRMGLPGRKDEAEVMFDFRDHQFKSAA
jgi:twinkle protein